MVRRNENHTVSRACVHTHQDRRAMPSQEITLKVAMACSGCSGAVERVLNKTKGVESVECDLDTQLVVVVTDGSIGKEKVR